MEFFTFDNVFYDRDENYVSDQKMVQNKFVYLLNMNNFVSNNFFVSPIVFL